MVSLVVNIASLPNVHSRRSSLGWLVVQLAIMQSIPRRVGGIVKTKQDDLLFWDTVLFGDLVGVAYISLVAIVAKR